MVLWKNMMIPNQNVEYEFFIRVLIEIALIYQRILQISLLLLFLMHQLKVFLMLMMLILRGMERRIVKAEFMVL